MIPKENIIEILKKIKDPESEQSLHDLQIVKQVDYEEDEKKLIIVLDFKAGGKPIDGTIQKKIVEDIENEFFEFKGIREIEFKYL